MKDQRVKKGQKSDAEKPTATSQDTNQALIDTAAESVVTSTKLTCSPSAETEPKTRQSVKKVPQKVHASRGLHRNAVCAEGKNQEATSATCRGNRLVWMSDEDVVEGSDTTYAGQSCIPPLTTHNVAKHNYNIISRQSSAASVVHKTKKHSRSQVTESFRADMPSTSREANSPYEASSNLPERLWKTVKNLLGHGEVPEEIKDRPKTLRRSRTTAINIKDIPSLDSLEDSDPESERTGKKSSASTSKLHHAIQSSLKKSAIARLRNDDNKVRIFDVTSQLSSSPSRSLQSEMTSLPSCRTSPAACENDAENMETFSIPGTVSERSLTFSPGSEGKSRFPSGDDVICVTLSPTSGNNHGKRGSTMNQRRRTNSRSTGTSEYSRRSVPPSINEEDIKDDENTSNENRLQRKQHNRQTNC